MDIKSRYQRWRWKRWVCKNASDSYSLAAMLGGLAVAEYGGTPSDYVKGLSGCQGEAAKSVANYLRGQKWLHHPATHPQGQPQWGKE